MQNKHYFRQRTKIVVTIGPATSSAATIERLIKAGMNVARLNLSHGTASQHARYIRTVRRIARRLGTLVAILIDLAGPKYRVGSLSNDSAELKKGASVVLTTRRVTGNAGLIPVSLATFPRMLKAGDTILIDDGAFQLKVNAVGETEVESRVVVGGRLTPGRGIVVPGMPSTGPYLTRQLKEQLEFAAGQEPDYLALSFVGEPDDVEQVRAALGEKAAAIPIISKIERGQAVKNFDSLLAVSDAIMVARGDLGVDIPLPKIPLVQKEIIRKCNRAGKPVITATQMLESMILAARPTRAEVTDVANAIFDGSDAVMLSAETSIGKYPVGAVRMMAQIARETESRLPYESVHTERGQWLNPQTDEIIGYAASHSAHQLKAAAIVAFTQSGSTAQRVAKYRPRMPVIAMTPSRAVCGRVLLSWGVQPYQIAGPAAVDRIFAIAGRVVKELGLAQAGDLIVITAGIPIGIPGSTNLLKVETIS
jgi:pyruvate kinase